MPSASKSTTLWSNNGNGYTVTASFWENSTSTANNTSNITCKATITSQGAAWSSSYNSTLVIYWYDNREKYDRWVASINLSSLGVGASASAQGTINVTHNNDGSLAGHAYAYFTKGGTSAYTPNSGGIWTDDVALTKIPRAATINSFTGTDINKAFRATYTTKGSGFTYKLRISIPNVRALDTFNNYSSGTDVYLSKASIDYIKSYTRNKTIQLGGVIETWSGGTKIGESSEPKITCNIRRDMYINVGGTYKRATAYVRIGNEWKEARPYLRANNEWKEGI